MVIVAAMPLAAHAAPPPPPTGPLADWPCSPRAAEPLSLDAVYGKPLAIPTGARDWQSTPPVRDLVNFIAAPENGPDQGRARIAAFVPGAGTDRVADLDLTLVGLVDRTNEFRQIVAYGVREKVEKSKFLADFLTESRRAIDQLPANAPAETRKVLEQDRLAKSHALGDNAEDAELLCHRLDYTETKAKRLAAAIDEQISK